MQVSRTGTVIFYPRSLVVNPRDVQHGRNRAVPRHINRSKIRIFGTSGKVFLMHTVRTGLELILDPSAPRPRRLAESNDKRSHLSFKYL